MALNKVEICGVNPLSFCFEARGKGGICSAGSRRETKKQESSTSKEI